MNRLIHALCLLIVGSVHAESFNPIWSRDCTPQGCYNSQPIYDDRNQNFLKEIGDSRIVFTVDRTANESSHHVRAFDITGPNPNTPVSQLAVPNEQYFRFAGGLTSAFTGVTAAHNLVGAAPVATTFRVLMSPWGGIIYHDAESIPGITSHSSLASLRSFASQDGNVFVNVIQKFPNAAFVIYQIMGSQVFKFGPFDLNSFGSFKQAALSPDGRYLALTYTGKIDVVDINLLKTGNPLSTSVSSIYLNSLSSGIISLAVSQDNKIVACGINPTASPALAQVEMIMPSGSGSWTRIEKSLPANNTIGNICSQVVFSSDGQKLWAITKGADNYGLRAHLLSAQNLSIINSAVLSNSTSQTVAVADSQAKGNKLVLAIHAAVSPSVYEGNDLFLLDASKRRMLVGSTKVQNSTGLADVALDSGGSMALILSRSLQVINQVFRIEP